MILFNGHKVEFGRFPNGEIYLEKTWLEMESLYNDVVFKYEGDFEGEKDLFKLLLLRQVLRNTSTLHIPYVPYSRMDRDSKDYTFSLLTFTSFINAMAWDEVVIYEPHSDVTPALLDRVRVRNVVFPYLIDCIALTDYQLFFPDAGAQKRYESASDNALVGFKKRDFKTGKILRLDILGEREKDTVVIVDDLCSKGGTFVLAAKRLREIGFTTVILVVAHCEKTIFSGQVFDSKLIDQVITTDSILETEEFHSNLHIVKLGDINWKS